MKAKHRRLMGLLTALLIMGGGATAILVSFKQQLVFFFTPTQYHEQLAAGSLPKTASLRIGGLVKKGSVYHTQEGGIGFVISDGNDEIHARYRGLVPSLFREGQGVVAQGSFNATGELVATTILAKHDENYMPREVVDQLKKSGQWQHDYQHQPMPANDTDNTPDADTAPTPPASPKMEPAHR